MSQVLYRTFRPQKFAEVVNQETVKITLKNAVSANTVAHAYLFTGPRGVGKTSMARILARVVNCEKPADGEPCGKCEICQAISDGNFFDLIEVDAASNTGVDNIREIIEHVKFSPSRGKYKVIVIDEVHMLSKGAFNALLKTLEEPPAHAIFVLATTEIHKVPATIISRTQKFDFKRLNQKDILGQLSKVAKYSKAKISAEGLALIARASTGSMRDALSLLDQSLSFSKDKVGVEELEQMLGIAPLSSFQAFLDLLTSGNTGESLLYVKQLADDGKDMQQFANGFLEYLEKVMQVSFAQANTDNMDVTKEDAERLKQQVQNLPGKQIARLLDLFITASQKVRYASLPQLPLELAAFEFIENQESSSAMPVKQNVGFKNAVEKNISNEKTKTDTKPYVSTAETAQGGQDINFKHHWNDILNKVREYNHSLLSSLRLARIVNSEPGILQLAFPYRFHKDVVEQRKNRIIVEAVLQEVLNKPHKVVCLMEHEAEDVVPTGQTKISNDSNLINEAAKVFGATSQSS